MMTASPMSIRWLALLSPRILRGTIHPSPALEALPVFRVAPLGLLMLSQFRLGIEIKSLGTALVAALVLGILNAIVRPILGFFALPITILTLGLFALVLNALMIMLMAALVKGVQLRNGFWGALIVSILLSIFNAIVAAIIF